MRINFIRKGFAFNSSSSHSIISSDKKFEDNISVSGEYGWECFVLASKEEKKKYLACCLVNTIRNLINIDVPAQLMDADKLNKFINSTIINYIKENIDYDLGSLWNERYYVDHDSIISFPQQIGYFPYKDNTPIINIEYAKEFIKYICNEDIYILGGSDNNYDHPLKATDKKDKKINLKEMYKQFYHIATKVNENYWIMHNKNSGTTAIINFDDKELPEKLSIPYLVDIKITDNCTKNCDYCYQDSKIIASDNNNNKDYSDYKYIKNIIQELANAGTVEIVFGGGEPTSYKHIDAILECAKSLSISTSITTKEYNSKNWINFNTIIKKVDAIAISVNSINDLDQAKILIDTIKSIGNCPIFAIQSIVGISEFDEFIQIAKLATQNYISFSIVGFKRIGRGNNTIIHKYPDNWLDQILSITKTISVDSVIISSCKDKLDNLNIPMEYRVGREGKYTCYIDAVNKTIAPSSFCNKEEILDLSDPKDLIKKYLTF